eukprot:g7662.t1
MGGYILAIDQGTTSTRAIVFDAKMTIAGMGQKEFGQIFPQIEARQLAAIGITNQRETVVVWDRETGKPIHNAIVWQDRRTSAQCEALKRKGMEKLFTRRTGLLLDPYFSGTKLSWLLAKIEGARARAAKGKLCFGTVDSYLIWRLTGGRSFVTDATNASRSLIYDIARNRWDEELAELLRIPMAMLAEVKDCSDDFGVTEKHILGAEIPILGVAGDQQAATIGQACFQPGMVKSTYGTGCFAVLNTGQDLVRSKNRLLSTIAYRLNGRTTYALEGSIFIAGAAVQWLRDGLGLIESAGQSGQLAAEADPQQDIYLVPAFTGLGAPHWDAEARGAMYGLTRATGPAEFARAALEAVCYQTSDLLAAMTKDWRGHDGRTVLRVDGGMVASDWTMQRLADLLDAPVDRPHILETTALGAAWLAGSRAGVWPGQEEFAHAWARERRFEPSMDARTRKAKMNGWKDAVRRTLM